MAATRENAHRPGDGITSQTFVRSTRRKGDLRRDISSATDRENPDRSRQTWHSRLLRSLPDDPERVL